MTDTSHPEGAPPLPRTWLNLKDQPPGSALDREWLVTNGIGGYAFASLAGANTRRYHGLLVAALQPPLGRTVLLAKLDEQAELDGKTFNLEVNEWQDATASLEGLQYLEGVEINGTLPTFHYRLGDAGLTKTIWLEYGLNTTYVRYTATGKGLELRVRPLANSRDYHGTTRGQPQRPFEVVAGAEPVPCWRVRAGPGEPEWWLLALEGEVEWQPATGQGWYWGFHYRKEQERGLPGANEDLYCPGTYRVRLEPGQAVTLAATTVAPEVVAGLYPASYRREIARQQELLGGFGRQRGAGADLGPELTGLVARLGLAADQFVAGRPDPHHPGQLAPDYRTVLAGYPWFNDWGRDTMIALPGLTIVTGRFPETATILRTFARYVSRGMLPNRFPDRPGPGQFPDEGEYNTVDATLWYFDAIAKYLAASDDQELARDLYPVLADIVRWHVEGTRYGIRLDQDGLLSSGQPGVQLTWMDVKIGDWVVTPRHGKPIEINALWYRACRVMAGLSRQWGSEADTGYYEQLAGRVAARFENTYWYDQGGYLFDCIDRQGRPDPALRPNQVLALAVAPELVAVEKRRRALEKVRQELLVPYGLRTLAPTDPAYRPVFAGNNLQRDGAYHQGTVWPWLLGPYARAGLSLEADPAGRRNLLEQFLRPFGPHLDAGEAVGQVSEVFGASPPFAPGGCVAQAWSVSELLEIWQLARIGE